MLIAVYRYIKYCETMKINLTLILTSKKLYPSSKYLAVFFVSWNEHQNHLDGGLISILLDPSPQVSDLVSLG